MYLLDTNVISELRRTRPHGAVLSWISNIPRDQIFLPAYTIGEIQAGIEITREQDRIKAEEIESWLDEVLATFVVLPMDANSFREWARLKHRKSVPLEKDAMIAATAVVHNLIVVTRNTRGFVELGVDCLNPFETQ